LPTKITKKQFNISGAETWKRCMPPCFSPPKLYYLPPPLVGLTLLDRFKTPFPCIQTTTSVQRGVSLKNRSYTIRFTYPQAFLLPQAGYVFHAL